MGGEVGVSIINTYEWNNYKQRRLKYLLAVVGGPRARGRETVHQEGSGSACLEGRSKGGSRKGSGNDAGKNDRVLHNDNRAG